ncbi:MAG: hypothetical protein A3F87_01675 [Omnitrophica WOR_2 bacterium RIFCSPLOWO2_12_FULL_51_24]|nr:MAG: hypothetical protein A2879_05070 [Omnitrophica WOR_2 bacterium RIFCSPHIGHO2_01_FULL_49_10]OGX32653.1 MAG: hypothetical protein A3I43_03215 [Omnitrophica WOR_2 bacterium RIFCSPLOWO2_02_FULL_50_19]OGX41920.1 MAG: hypothetical protein A3F87_01675 [Omnitrophica WOR_2 bacterium RIFCSPLOWO2_12_FULL_51_24]
MKVGYPNLRIGYILAAFSSLGWLVKIMHLKGFEVLGVIAIAGCIYWCWCVFRTHKVMKKITGGEFARDPSQAVLYFLIPVLNIFWGFIWTSRITRFLNRFRTDRKINGWIPGLAFAVSFIAFFCFFPLFIFGIFWALSYLVKNIKETVELDKAGAGALAANISKYEIQSRKRKSILRRVVSISVVLLVFSLLSMPWTMLLPVYREGARLVPLIEDYKVKHGVYPDTLEQLGGKIKYAEPGIRGMRYTTYDEGKNFSLVCFANLPGIKLREAYNSTTKEWRQLK